MVGAPILHDLGVNFHMLGLVEHPYKLSRFRLQGEAADPTEAAPFVANGPLTEVWTDGSVVWPHSFWLTTATFTVIGKTGNKSVPDASSVGGCQAKSPNCGRYGLHSS